MDSRWTLIGTAGLIGNHRVVSSTWRPRVLYNCFYMYYNLFLYIYIYYSPNSVYAMGFWRVFNPGGPFPPVVDACARAFLSTGAVLDAPRAIWCTRKARSRHFCRQVQYLVASGRPCAQKPPDPKIIQK